MIKITVINKISSNRINYYFKELPRKDEWVSLDGDLYSVHQVIHLPPSELDNTDTGSIEIIVIPE